MSDTIEAGDYEISALFWEEITSKPGQPLDFVRHHRGDVVHLSRADARRLVEAGAVKRPGEPSDEVPGRRESSAPGEDPGDLVSPAPGTPDATAAVDLADAEQRTLELEQQLDAIQDKADVAAEVARTQQLAREDAEQRAARAERALAELQQQMQTGDEPKSDGITDILQWVGADPARATTRLDAEKAKGDKARPRLVGQLEEIVTAPQGSS